METSGVPSWGHHSPWDCGCWQMLGQSGFKEHLDLKRA